MKKLIAATLAALAINGAVAEEKTMPTAIQAATHCEENKVLCTYALMEYIFKYMALADAFSGREDFCSENIDITPTELVDGMIRVVKAKEHLHNLELQVVVDGLLRNTYPCK